MNFKLFLFLLFFTGTLAHAQNQQIQNGVLLRADSVECGLRELGATKQSHKLACKEYTMYTDETIYRFRPVSQKSAALAPMGNLVEFRIANGKMLLKVSDSVEREQEYRIVSATARSQQESGQHSTASLHDQQ